jgi:hypothetical protein
MEGPEENAAAEEIDLDLEGLTEKLNTFESRESYSREIAGEILRTLADLLSRTPQNPTLQDLTDRALRACVQFGYQCPLTEGEKRKFKKTDLSEEIAALFALRLISPTKDELGGDVDGPLDEDSLSVVHEQVLAVTAP